MQELTSLSQADVFCVYGVPDPEFTSELEEWLEEEKNRVVLILEDEEKNLLSFSPKNERMKIFSAKTSAGLKKAAWEWVFLEFDYAKRPGNPSKSLHAMEEIFSQMAFFQRGIHLVASKFKERGLDLLENFLKNSQLFSTAYPGQALFGKFHGIPAVICGAGPSLEKAMPLLHIIQDRALLFGGGTTLASLSTAQLTPHFAGMIDPHLPEARLFFHEAIENPVFFQAFANYSLLKRFQGPFLHIPGNENDFFEKEVFEGGWNVTTFLTSLACHMGCNPIILVGVDLAQKEDRCYAGGLPRSEGGDLIQTKEGFWTRRDWLFAADWFSDFANKHPEVEWINASEGLPIRGFKEKGLPSIAFDRQIDLIGRIHSEIQNSKRGIYPEFSSKKLIQSFAKVSELCVKMIALLEKLFPNNPDKNGEYALLQLEIEKEKAYVQFLQPVWEVWKHVFAREISPEIPKAYGIGLNQWLFMKEVSDEARKI